jgi:flavocytochrome c
MKRLILAAVAATLVTLVGCAGSDAVPQAESDGVDERVEIPETRTEVVVVGGGGAGLSAALHAAEIGAKVIVLEKLDAVGGSLRITSGTMSAANTEMQAEQEIEDSIASYYMDIMREGDFKGNSELVMKYCETATEVVDWFSEHELWNCPDGAVFAPEHTLYSQARSYKPIAPEGYKSAALAILVDAVKDRSGSIEVLLETEVVELLKEEDGAVMSVVAVDADGSKRRFRGSKGVVVATGGFHANPAMMEQYAEGARHYITGGLPSADGRGIAMVSEVGGAITKEAMSWIPSYPMGFETKPGQGIIFTSKTQINGGIQVNLNGERFVDETATNVVREEALPKQPDGVMFEVFDETIKNATLDHPFYGNFLRAAVARGGFLVQADTIEGLAEKIGVDPDALRRTVDVYNGYVAVGEDEDFGREITNNLDDPPFYALRLKPIALMTMGGIQVNEKMQVVDNLQNPIPGLYAAGECVGGIWGTLPSSGTGVTGAIVFGKLAGEAIVSEPLPAYNEPVGLVHAISYTTAEVDAAIVYEDAETYADGTYRGRGEGMNGEVVIEVTVEDGRIAEIRVIEHAETEDIAKGAVEKIPAAIVAEQTLNVDSVSGATFVSDAIRAATADALEAAR